MAGMLRSLGLGISVLFGCSRAVAPSWDSIEGRIRREFPDVESISTEELAARLERDGDVVVVDVRDVAEFEVSRIPGAVHVAMGAGFEGRLSAAVSARGPRDVVLYCSVGYRSAQAAEVLAARGWERVFNLRGSIFRWANEGRPLVDEAGPARRVHPYDDEWGELLNAELRAGR